MMVFGSAFVLALAPYRRRSVVLLDIRSHTSESMKERKVKRMKTGRKDPDYRLVPHSVSLQVPSTYLREKERDEDKST